MKMLFDTHLRRDIIKLLYLIIALSGTIYLFILTPALSTPTLLSIVITMLLSPFVTALERRGYPRALSIGILFGLVGGISILASFWAMQSGKIEWDTFKAKTPEYFAATIQKLREYETSIQSYIPFAHSFHPIDNVVTWGQETGKWFVTNGPALMGDLITCFFIVPFLSFVMLNEGRVIRRRFFQLIPNRFFEIAFMMTHGIITALSDYLRAKLVEAILVGIMTSAGLAIVGAPYAVVLGIVAGVTNILPYIGPILGAIPGLIIVIIDNKHQGLLWPVASVYFAANLIDMILIFPVIVAKLIDLHPLIPIAVVAVGQKYYGLIGMLISIPLATATKVILHEIYSAIYEDRSRQPIRSSPNILKKVSALKLE